MSNNQTIETSSDAPIIYIESVGGNLRIKGREGTQIGVRSELYDVPITTTEDGVDTVRLPSFKGDCRLEAPHNASIKIGTIGGDAEIKSLEGEVTLERVGGNLRLRKIGALHGATIGGDLQAKKIFGNLHIEKAGGNVLAMDVEGNLEIGRAGGDVKVFHIEGDVAAVAGGNATLRVSLGAEQVCRVQAGGDISCYLPADASAEVKLKSGRRTIKLRGWDIPPSDQESDVYQFTLGEGEAELELNAGGNIALRTLSDAEQAGTFDYEMDFDFGPDFQVEFDSNFGPFLSEWPQELSTRVQEKVQRAMRMAEEKVSEALRHAEERISRAEERAERMGERQTRRGPRRQHRQRTWTQAATPGMDYSWSFQTPTPPQPPQPPKAPRAPKSPQVNDEERMTVLRMVEEGKISVEQAEKLLEALSQ